MEDCATFRMLRYFLFQARKIVTHSGPVLLQICWQMEQGKQSMGMTESGQ